MGFPCERVRHKIKHRENNNCTQWSDDIDDRLQAKANTDQSNDKTNERLYTYRHHDHSTASDTVNQCRYPQKPIGHGIVKRITQLISFNPGHQGSTPTASAATTTTTASTTVTSHSQHLVRQSLCLYAASSFILALCYFTTSAAAAEAVHPM